MSEMAERWVAFSEEAFSEEEELWSQSLIARRGENTPRTHSLTDLMSLLGGRVREDLEDELRSLEGFYIPTRYPDAVPGSLPEGLPEERDAREAVTAAREASRTVREMSNDGSP